MHIIFFSLCFFIISSFPSLASTPYAFDTLSFDESNEHEPNISFGYRKGYRDNNVATVALHQKNFTHTPTPDRMGGVHDPSLLDRLQQRQGGGSSFLGAQERQRSFGEPLYREEDEGGDDSDFFIDDMSDYFTEEEFEELFDDL